MCNTVSLASINVGGISSKFRYHVLSNYIQKHHILFFGETKLQRIPQGEFPDHDIFSFKQKTQLHGLSILLKKDFFTYKKTLKGKSKCVLWLLLGTSEHNLLFIIGSVYIPGYNSKYADQNDFDIISEDILSFRNTYNCPFILMGDYNARTGDLSANTDLSGPVINVRRNCDKKVDVYGRNLVKMCKDLDLHIVNGSYGSDSQIGNFTCHKPTGKSCVDYCIMSPCLLPCISDFFVDTFDRFMSDVHSPICLDLKNVPVVKNIPVSHDNYEKIAYKSSWKPECKTEYQNSFVENDIMALSENILSREFTVNPSKEEIGQLVSDLTGVIVNPAKQTGLCKKIISKKGKPRKSPNQAWFSSECEQKRKNFFNAKNLVRKAQTEEEKSRLLSDMDKEGKEYKAFISAHQNSFSRELHKNLRKLHRHHPKEYWSILKNSDRTEQSEPKVSLSDFEKHFKQLNHDDQADSHHFDFSDIDLSTIEEFNLEFTLDEVLKNIRTLKTTKVKAWISLKTNT